MANFTVKEELRDVARVIIAKEKDVAFLKDKLDKIAFLESDMAKTTNGKMVFADCEKVGKKQVALHGYEFAITYYTPNSDLLDENQKEILMHHELLHVGYGAEDEPKIRPHDLEDFKSIIDAHGVDWNVPR